MYETMMEGKVLAISLILCVLVDLNHGFMCYECNSTTNSNCFEVEPTSNLVILAQCDNYHRREESCYYAHISEHKKRRMVRGCKRSGFCDEIENQEQTNIYFKVLSCGECSEDLCNSSNKLSARITPLFIFTFALKYIFNKIVI